MPDSVDEYVHRIGRTGRLDRKGIATSFITPEKQFMVGLINKTMERGRVVLPGEQRKAGTKTFRPARRR